MLLWNVDVEPKKQRTYTLLLLETGSLPFKIMAIERVVEYVLKVQKRTHKGKILCSGSMQDIVKWFGRWDATHLLHDASLDSSVNEAFLQHRYIMTWDKCGGSCFTHYTTDVATNYKTIFFAERGNRTHIYIFEPIPLSAIWTIASIWLSSHALRYETGRWGTSDECWHKRPFLPLRILSVNTLIT